MNQQKEFFRTRNRLVLWLSVTLIILAYIIAALTPLVTKIRALF